MYTRPMIHEPTMLPTTATGARNSARWASSATCAAVSHPSRVYTALNLDVIAPKGGIEFGTCL